MIEETIESTIEFEEDLGLIPSRNKSLARATNRHARRVAKERRQSNRAIARKRVQKSVREFYRLPDIWVDNERIAKSGLTYSQFTEHVVPARG